MSTAPESVSVMIQSASGLALITASVAPNTIAKNINIAIAIIALFLAGVCICRMNALSPRRHKLKVRLHYLFVFVGSLCLAGAPWFWPQYPRLGALIFLLTVVISLLLSTTEWHYGAPASANLSHNPNQRELEYDPESSPVANYLRFVWRHIKYSAALVDDLFRGNNR